MNVPAFPLPVVPLGGSVSSGGVTHPPASPLLAEAWLLAWGRIGGAVAVTADGRLQPWFHPDVGCADGFYAEALIAHLTYTPGLPAAVKMTLGDHRRSALQRTS